jgi:hypothetical protein
VCGEWEESAQLADHAAQSFSNLDGESTGWRGLCFAWQLQRGAINARDASPEPEARNKPRSAVVRGLQDGGSVIGLHD